jgi:AraC family transcriptional regulator
MRIETLVARWAPHYGSSWRSSATPGTEPITDGHGLCEEETWRCLAVADRRRQTGADIIISRWVDARSYCRQDETVSPSGRHIIGVALKTTQLKLTRGTHTVFDGVMAAGTVHVSGPSQPLTAEFRAPCDFLHFHVANDYLRILQDAARSGSQPSPNLNDLVVRDPLAELLSRTLVDNSSPGDELYAESVGHTFVMHVTRMERLQPKVNALPKWRLKRVHEYVDAHLDEPLSLADLAAVAGLSRMHFAAQFRAATGLRPHDFLLYQRIEVSKAILSGTNIPLAEVALTVGFHAQAHFSTVFKRMTGETPAGWRRAVVSERQSPCVGNASPKPDSDRAAPARVQHFCGAGSGIRGSV